MVAGEKSKEEVKNRAYRFSVAVIGYVTNISERQKIFYALTDQLIRSSTSIGANIVEAKSASSKRDFIRYFEIALKSANECKYWLCLFKDALKCDHETTSALIKEADEISKMLAKSIITMKSKGKS